MKRRSSVVRGISEIGVSPTAYLCLADENEMSCKSGRVIWKQNNEEPELTTILLAKYYY